MFHQLYAFHATPDESIVLGIHGIHHDQTGNPHFFKYGFCLLDHPT